MSYRINSYKKILLISVSVLSLNACIPAAIVGGAGILGYGVSQERSVGQAIDDAAIETEISALLLSSDVEHIYRDVDFDAVEGKILLTGNVKTLEAKNEAHRLAWKPKGVKEVINEIIIKEDNDFSGAQLASDAWVTTQIESLLLFEKTVSWRNYSVETKDGVVYLLGVAQSRDELEAAATIASSVKGVKKVISHVRLKRGSLLELEQKGSYVEDEDIKPANIKPIKKQIIDTEIENRSYIKQPVVEAQELGEIESTIVRESQRTYKAYPTAPDSELKPIEIEPTEIKQGGNYFKFKKTNPDLID